MIFDTTKLIVIGSVVAGLALAVWGYGHQRYNAGEAAAEARMQERVEKRNAQVTALDARVRELTEEKSHEIEKRRALEAAQADHALAAIQPVRLCKSAARRGEVPGTPGAAPAVDGAEAGEELPLQAGPDIGTALVMLAAECQRDYSDSVSWQDWYVTARQALTSPAPEP